ncbi:DNA-3-methyladenine glycosylase I [Flavobacterium sp. JP2137]|uniref:DNA-3-methyladenine glycosylase I n=1 Tax=Flavobacterium sp. JP2137 TaxID=3414510 RepID=UPI003D2FFADE
MMEAKKTYCDFANALDAGDANPNKQYHDTEYGFPIADDNELFARLILEINQAGLSWTIILKKKADFYRAYHDFDIATVAAYQQEDIDRLLGDSGIIRNKLKVNAAIYNAQQLLKIQGECGSFKNWLEAQHPKNKQEWVSLFKKHFKFTGGEIVNEFLMSIGYLPGAHQESCPIYNQLLFTKPMWMQQGE